MRLLFAVSLILSMSGTEIERAQALARARESERQQFHQRYVVNLPDPSVSQIEVVTEFRRLVIISEEHVLRGDWMFTRSIGAAQEALAPLHGVVTITARVRFNPLNTFIEPPPYVLAIGGPAAGAALEALDTNVTPQYSVPFKASDGRNLSSLLGATLDANIPADRIGQSPRTIGVILDGTEVTRTVVDFRRLD